MKQSLGLLLLALALAVALAVALALAMFRAPEIRNVQQLTSGVFTLRQSSYPACDSTHNLFSLV